MKNGVLSDEKYKVEFHTHGFRIGEDISEKEWDKIEHIFLSMYNTFANYANSIVDRMNTIWNKCDYVMFMTEEDRLDKTRELLAKEMGLKKDFTYYDWIEKNYIEVAEVVNQMSEMMGINIIKGIIIRDGDNPLYGARFVQHPDWTFDFSLIEVK